MCRDSWPVSSAEDFCTCWTESGGVAAAAFGRRSQRLSSSHSVWRVLVDRHPRSHNWHPLTLARHPPRHTSLRSGPLPSAQPAESLRGTTAQGDWARPTAAAASSRFSCSSSSCVSINATIVPGLRCSSTCLFAIPRLVNHGSRVSAAAPRRAGATSRVCYRPPVSTAPTAATTSTSTPYGGDITSVGSIAYSVSPPATLYGTSPIFHSILKPPTNTQRMSAAWPRPGHQRSGWTPGSPSLLTFTPQAFHLQLELQDTQFAVVAIAAVMSYLLSGISNTEGAKYLASAINGTCHKSGKCKATSAIQHLLPPRTLAGATGYNNKFFFPSTNLSAKGTLGGLGYALSPPAPISRHKRAVLSAHHELINADQSYAETAGSVRAGSRQWCRVVARHGFVVGFPVSDISAAGGDAQRCWLCLILHATLTDYFLGGTAESSSIPRLRHPRHSRPQEQQHQHRSTIQYLIPATALNGGYDNWFYPTADQTPTTPTRYGTLRYEQPVKPHGRGCELPPYIPAQMWSSEH